MIDKKIIEIIKAEIDKIDKGRNWCWCDDCLGHFSQCSKEKLFEVLDALAVNSVNAKYSMEGSK